MSGTDADHAVGARADDAAAHRPCPSDPDAPGWRRPAPTAQDLRNDRLLAGALLVGALLSLVLWQVAGVYDEPAPGWVSALVLAAVSLPLALRRRWPAAVGVVVAVGFYVGGTAHVPEMLVTNICLFVALYTIGAWDADRRRALWVRGALVAGMFVWLTVSLGRAMTDPDALPSFERAGAFSPLVAYLLIQVLTNVAYFGGAWWFGDHAWNAARQRARTELRTVELERERRRVAHQAVALERLRLARELHDAVAHHVSLMGVQAGAARSLVTTDPAAAAEVLEGVEGSARQAIDELHSILGTLRDPDVPPSDAVGSLGVERLPDLVDDVRAAGLPVDLQVVGEPVPLPPTVSLNLYRIVQEALTNTRKHAGPHARADVRVRYLDGAVEVEVTDDGVGARRPVREGGRGLTGMRERVAADGGTVVAEPMARGGFLVRAQVPLRRLVQA